MVGLLARGLTLRNQLPHLHRRLDPPRPAVPDHRAMALLGDQGASQIRDPRCGRPDHALLVCGLHRARSLPKQSGVLRACMLSGEGCSSIWRV